MSAKKQRTKQRRRARKLAEQAWAAAEDDHFDLALKIIHRAVELNPGNPVLWNDQGLLLTQFGNKDEAAAAFEAAIRLAPDFAEAHAHLAGIRAGQGQMEQAAALQQQAVRLAPDSAHYREVLASYQAQINPRAALSSSEEATTAAVTPTSDSLRSDFPHIAARVAELDWPQIEHNLTRRGFAHIAQFASAELCATLREMFDDDRRFAKTVTMNKSRFGMGLYRYFAPPLPGPVDAIRQLMYPPCAGIANAWHGLLGGGENFPDEWPAFGAKCAEAGQTTPAPLMLLYETDGFNALHQDLRGPVYFPIQLVIVLSQRSNGGTNDTDAFVGGDFLFSDEPRRKDSDLHKIPAGLGDAVLFCTRSRLLKVGGVYGLKPVKHGMDRIVSGTRYAIGIPFHDFE